MINIAQVKLIEIGQLPEINYSKETRRTIEEILKPYDLSFSVENVSRAKTHEICEANDSYTQQSMRYVKMGKDDFVIPPVFSDSLKKEFSKTMLLLFDNYAKLSELKEEFESVKGRPKPDWFKYAPIEDSRYALSLATPSHIMVTMDASQLPDFFGSLSADFETRDIFGALAPYLPKDLAHLCYHEIGTKDFSSIAKVHEDKLKRALEGIYVDIKPGRLKRAGLGALTSTNEGALSAILDKYEAQGNADEKLAKVALRVIGYGHESVAEHARSGLGLSMSLVTYHQFERHRLAANVREHFGDLPLDREVLIPPKVKESQESVDIFNSSVAASRDIREKILYEHEKYNHFALLNGTLIGVYSNTNARSFGSMARERLCNNAQWEIQQLLEDTTLKLRADSPELYKNCAPKCVIQGKCPEGKLGCGRFLEMKEKYKQ